jgi:uncharacterized phiE125 gp8 family phage protein
VIVVVTPPTDPVVTVDEAKDHLRLATSADDAQLEAMIAAATAYVEGETARHLLTTELRLVLDCFPCVVEIPRAPIQSIDEIRYLDFNGTQTVLATTDYRVGLNSLPARITPSYAAGAWPTVQSVIEAVEIDLTAGYGDDPADVPSDLLHAIKLLVAAMYEHREDFVVGTITAPIPLAAARLISRYRIPSSLVAVSSGE